MVLDIMLPGLNGYKVLEQLRERKIWTPVLMLTAKDGEYDQTGAFDLGADDYLTKPFSFMVLTARLRALVRRGGTRAAGQADGRLARARPGPPLRDPARGAGQAHRTGVRLRPYLMRNAGSVVSKFEILENVWDPAYDGGENVVEVRPADPDHRPRQGYRLDADIRADG